MQKPVKKSHFEGIKELDKINNYLVDADRDMFNFYQYFINFPKVYIQATQPSIPADSIALWDNTTTGHRYWLWNTGGTQNALDFAAAGGAGVNHALLSNLTYATAGHTGFQATLTTGSLIGSSPISVAGGNGAVIGGGAVVSIAQASTSQGGYVSATDWGTFNAKADYLFGANNFLGTGNFVTTDTLSGNVVTVNSANVAGPLTVTTGNIYVNSGNIAIGTLNPSYKLDIQTTAPTARLKQITAGGNAAIFYLDGYRTANSVLGQLFFSNNADTVASVQSWRSGADDAADLRFYTQATGGSLAERGRFDSTGNFGIGVTPTQPLHVSGNILCTQTTSTNALASKSINLTAITKTGNYTVTTSESVVVFSSAGTCTLPTAGATSRIIWVKNVSTGNVTLDGAGTDNIDGVATQTLYSFEGVNLVDYTSGNWAVI